LRRCFLLEQPVHVLLDAVGAAGLHKAFDGWGGRIPGEILKGFGIGQPNVQSIFNDFAVLWSRLVEVAYGSQGLLRLHCLEVELFLHGFSRDECELRVIDEGRSWIQGGMRVEVTVELAQPRWRAEVGEWGKRSFGVIGHSFLSFYHSGSNYNLPILGELVDVP
jgi:hypothetical protein